MGATLLLVCLVYLAVVLAIGAAAYRRTGTGSEEYFLGGRTARTVVLFMALLGTNVTPFVLMGIPGQAYHHGVGVFGLNAAIVALGIPWTFYAIGWPAWKAARRVGAITPAELFSERLGSPAVGVVLFVAFVVYTLPYLVTSVLGVGIAVSTLTHDAVTLPVAAALILVVTLGYTAVGGMKATMWTNVFQGAVFMAFIVVAFFAVADGLGGFSAATEAVREVAPQLLRKGDRPPFAPGAWASWGLAISLTVIAFPHMLVRIFAARDVTALKNSCRLYPVSLVLLWVPAVVFGVWGAAAIPGLQGQQSDRIFPLLVQAHMGPVMQGIALAGVLAAVMSTVDAQLLTLGSMLSRDVVRRLAPTLPDRLEVAWSRGFVLVLSVVTFLVVLWRPASIFGIAKFSFSGYVMLVPTMYGALHWRRTTAAGAIASVVAGNAILLATWTLEPPLGGLLPVAWGLLAAIVALVVVSWRTRPPPPAVVERALGPAGGASAGA
ncbi:sodium:solute symporter family protein [Paraliomyxa miuraensis]|uniref:sodium:solute symporter family protein n=1 Tax=Paraliomyxa miuraensis TaxID=376150 RepID=UPI002259B8F9|nr:sodium:solute symporter family protein [Paraliomyxa miuraensis]MCX4242420.1 sodium:solute symporter family protein [Paraliomyxa miuraensis]